MDIKILEDQILRLEKRLERERKARQEAESLLEEKSRQIYEANNKLHEESRLFEAAIVHAKDGVIITDADLDNGGPRILYVNKAFTQISGYEAEEVIGKTPRILQGDDTCKDTLHNLKSALSKGRSFQGELKNYTKDGDSYWLDISVVPVKNKEGKITHFAAIERNITDRKLFEKELENTILQAESANRSKSEFLANMSHELRTPMNGIIGLSDLLFDTTLDQEQKESVTAINRSAEGLLVLLNDILDFSKIEAGQMTLENVPFDLRQTVDETISLLKTQAENKNIELTCNFSPSVPHYIVSDSARLRQVLTNLIGNALKFTLEGWVSVDISTRIFLGRSTLFCRVDDTGIGISQNRLEDIFQKFTQADESTTRRFGGTGLGLAISKTIIEMMGGTIGVESIPGEGSSFWFEIPLIEATQTPIETVHDISVSELSNLPKKKNFDGEKVRILVVDDHPVNLMLARKLLKKMGIERIQLANGGQEAFEYTQVCIYDAILMDCQMPDMDGFQATQAIRKMHRGQALHTPIIAVTANAMKGDREKCIEAGMDDYISKPIKFDILYEILSKWIQNKPEEDKRENSSNEVLENLENIPVDLEHFNFMFEGNTPQETQELIELFDQQALLSIAALEQCCIENSQEEWKKIAHKLKGSAANFGAVDLSRVAAEAEKMIDPSQEQKHQIILSIQSEFERLQNYIHFMIGIENTQNK